MTADNLAECLFYDNLSISCQMLQCKTDYPSCPLKEFRVSRTVGSFRYSAKPLLLAKRDSHYKVTRNRSGDTFGQRVLVANPSIVRQLLLLESSFAHQR